MERLGLTFALMDAYGLTRLPETEVLAPTVAPDAVIREFHTDEYLDVLRAAGAGAPVPHAFRYGLGPGDNPIWPGVYEASALACGGAVPPAGPGARGAAARARRLPGGLPHPAPDRAAGVACLPQRRLA